MRIYYNQLESQLAQGLQSCYLIAGDEPLQVSEASDAIRKKAKTEGFTEREVLHADSKFQWDILFASMGTMSLFAEKKLIELHIPGGKPGTIGSKAIVRFIESIPSDICLLIQCDQWSGTNDKSKWVKTIENTGIFMRVYLPKPHEFANWIRNRCQKINLKVQNDAIAILSQRLEGNLMAAAQELEKLKMRFNDSEISAANILDLVADNARFDIFRLTDTLLQNDLARAIRMLRALKQENTAIVMIHWALERQIRILLHFAYLRSRGQNVSQIEYRKQGIWQSQQALIQSALNHLTVFKLEDLLSRLAQLDRIIKGRQSGDIWLQAERWITDFCK